MSHSSRWRQVTDMKGIIDSIVNGGTVVQVFVKNSKGFTTPITFDHSPFRWIWESEQGNLIGRPIEFDENKKTVRFLDRESD